MKGYYFITDCRLSRAGNAGDVAQALAAGVRVVQHRDKEASAAAMIAEARLLRRLCREALFLINDRVDVALAVDADGVHLGQEDLHYREARRLLGEKKIIGITVNTMEQAVEAARLGADYLGVSPIFATQTKPDAGEPAGLHLLREIRAPGQPPPHRHRRHHPGQCPRRDSRPAPTASAPSRRWLRSLMSERQLQNFKNSFFCERQIRVNFFAFRFSAILFWETITES